MIVFAKSNPARGPVAPKLHFGSVELLRVVAILGVIWFHIEGLAFRRVGFSGLIAFVIITFIFAGTSATRTGFSSFLRKRLRRLLLPWGFWFLAYMILNVMVGRTALPYSHDPISTLLAGPWIGLWYLPFAFGLSVLAFVLQNTTSQMLGRAIFIVSLICGVGLLFLAAWVRQSGFAVRPWAQWLHAAAAIPFGLAISKMLAGGRPRWEIVAACLAPLLYAGFSRFADPGLALPYLIAVPLTTLAFLSQVELPRAVPFLSSLCMGVYVLHGGLISMFRHLLPVESSPYLVFMLTATSAFAGAWLLSKIPLVKEVV